MSFLSPNVNSTLFNDLVGDLVAFPTTLGTYVVKPDGREYVRTGSARAVTSAYQLAAQQPITRVVGLFSSSGSTVVTGSVRDIAVGPAGQFAIVSSDTTNYFYTTDYGATWTAAAHGFASFAPWSIAYDATVGGWALAGSNTTTMEVRTTPTLGTATTQRVSVALTIVASEGVVVRSTGGRFVLVTGSSTGGSYYCTTLATWTAATTHAAAGAYATRMVVGSGRIVIFNSNPSTAYSNDGGVNWTAGTNLPLACISCTYNPADGNYYYQRSSSATFYKTSTGYSGYTTINWPDNGLSANRPSDCVSSTTTLNGEVLLGMISGNIAKTKDYIDYTVVQTMGSSLAGANILAVDSNGNFVQVPTGAAGVLYGNLNVCTYVGQLTNTRGDATVNVNTFTAYARIK